MITIDGFDLQGDLIINAEIGVFTIISPKPIATLLTPNYSILKANDDHRPPAFASSLYAWSIDENGDPEPADDVLLSLHL